MGPKRGGHGGPPIQVVTTGALYVASPTGRYYGGVIRCKSHRSLLRGRHTLQVRF